MLFYEDWLVVVTSNHGGKEDGSYGGKLCRGTKYVWDILLSTLYGTEDARKKKMYGAYF